MKKNQNLWIAVAICIAVVVGYFWLKSPPPVQEQTSSRPSSEATVPSVPLRAPLLAADGGLARIVAVGDLHGDLAATRAVLKLAGAIDDKDHWSGGDLVLVQTGDEIDRGDDDRAILDLFGRLEGEARAAGGRVVALNGNHELMNVEEDFRYVTAGAMDGFSDLGGRKAAFKAGTGAYAKILAKRDVIGLVGDTVFVHGGVLPKYAREIDNVNKDTKAWLRGEQPAPNAVHDERGPVWSRDYAEESGCTKLKDALAQMGVRRMVIGHTVQKDGITSGCDGHVHRIDVGMSKFYGGKPSALEIRGDAVKVLK